MGLLGLRLGAILWGIGGAATANWLRDMLGGKREMSGFSYLSALGLVGLLFLFWKR